MTSTKTAVTSGTTGQRRSRRRAAPTLAVIATMKAIVA